MPSVHDRQYTIWIERPALKPVSAHQPDRKLQFPLLYPPEQSASDAREAEYLAAIEVFY